MNRPSLVPPAPRNAREAEALIERLATTMRDMIRTLEEETALVKKGALGKAALLEPTKADLARRYMVDAELVKTQNRQLKTLVPEMVAELARAHDTFKAVLQLNLTVLATAHAVSEGIIKGVATEMAKKAAPTTYSALGRTGQMPRSAHQPIAISRSL
jgi:hypothetical protein